MNPYKTYNLSITFGDPEIFAEDLPNKIQKIFQILPDQGNSALNIYKLPVK